MKILTELDIETWLEEELHCEAKHRRGFDDTPSELSCTHEVTSYFTACYLGQFGKPALYVCENFALEVLAFTTVNWNKPCLFCHIPIQNCSHINRI